MRKLQFTLTFFIVFSFSLNGAFADPMCGVLLSSSDQINAYGESPLDGTGQFIAYLRALLDRGMIDEQQLSYFVFGLKRGEVLNPLEDRDSSTSEIQGGGIQEYINRFRLDQDQLLDWAEQELEERKRIQVARKGTNRETEKPYQKIEFHPVRVGSFEMGYRSNVIIDLTYPIEVMSTPVTQAQWAEIMGENPSGFKYGEHRIVVNLDGKRIEMQPDHPVENINWWSTLVFANKLSEKHGLAPAYDLTDAILMDGAMEEKIKIHANGGVHNPYDGDIYYQAEGYRLPTAAEQAYLLRAGGIATGIYAFGKGEFDGDYGWYRKNSKGETHPVAELKPMVLDGKAFYDLYGNVWEWGWDWWSRGPEGGKNPVGPKTGSVHAIRGGSWNTERHDLSFFQAVRPSYLKEIVIGFRLVRTIGGQ